MPDEVIEATLPELEPALAAMVRLQRLTGMRPGEVCSIRPCDLDTESSTHEEVTVWLYRPADHKPAHRDQERVVAIGSRGQEVLRPYLDRDPED